MQAEECPIHNEQIIQLRNWNKREPTVKICPRCREFEYNPIEYKQKVEEHFANVLGTLQEVKQQMKNQINQIIQDQKENNIPIPQWIGSLYQFMDTTKKQIKSLKQFKFETLDDQINSEEELNRIQQNSSEELNEFVKVIDQQYNRITDLKKLMDI